MQRVKDHEDVPYEELRRARDEARELSEQLERTRLINRWLWFTIIAALEVWVWRVAPEKDHHLGFLAMNGTVAAYLIWYRVWGYKKNRS